MMTKRSVAGLFLIISGGICAIIAMATEGWFQISDSDGDILSVGLKTYTWKYKDGRTETGTTKSLSQRWDLNAAGDAVLGCGSVGLFLALVGIILWFIGTATTSMKLRACSIVATYIGGFFLLLGYILCSRKIYVGYSFILFILASFIAFAAAVIMLSAQLQSSPTAYTQHTTSTTSTSSAPTPATTTSESSSWWRRSKKTTTTTTTTHRELNEIDPAEADSGYIPPGSRTTTRSAYAN